MVCVDLSDYDLLYESNAFLPDMTESFSLCNPNSSPLHISDRRTDSRLFIISNNFKFIVIIGVLKHKHESDSEFNRH